MVSKAVLNDSVKKDLAVKFITFMTSADTQKQWLTSSSVCRPIPPKRKIRASPMTRSCPVPWLLWKMDAARLRLLRCNASGMLGVQIWNV